MSMEIWVLSDRQLKSTAEWQAAVDAESYPLQLSADVAFEALRGFFPMQLRGERSGCECYHDPADELIKTNPKVDIGHAWKYVLGFRWGGDLSAMQSAWMAAAAYAAATGGIVVDDQELKVRTAGEFGERLRLLFGAFRTWKKFCVTLKPRRFSDVTPNCRASMRHSGHVKPSCRRFDIRREARS